MHRAFVVTGKAYSGTFLDKDLEGADKVVLAGSVLSQLMHKFNNRTLPSPVVFEVRNDSLTEHKTHCGVLEFSAPDENVYMPRWMMDCLMLEEGDPVRLRLKSLSKGTKVVFSTSDSKILQLPDPQTTLQHGLMTFTTLTAGNPIKIRYYDAVYDVQVDSVQPGTAVCIVNTNLTVEFKTTASEEELKKGNVEWHVLTPLMQRADSLTGQSTFSNSATEDDENELATALNQSVDPGSWRYFKYRAVDPSKSVIFATMPKQGGGKCGVFVSTRTTPTLDKHTWKAVGGQPLFISKDAASFTAGGGWFFVGVYGYQERCTFDLAVFESSASPHQQQRDVNANVLLRQMSESKAPEGSVRCTCCRSFVPQQALDMHLLRCERLNYFCETCSAVIRRATKDQHVHCGMCGVGFDDASVMEHHFQVTHIQTTCACGAVMDPALRVEHEKNECKLRSVPCKYCKTLTPFQALQDHQSYCGGKSVPCTVCSRMVAQRKMEIHLATEHKINPSIMPVHILGQASVPISDDHIDPDMPRLAFPPSSSSSSSSSSSAVTSSSSSAFSASDMQASEEALFQQALKASMMDMTPTRETSSLLQTSTAPYSSSFSSSSTATSSSASSSSSFALQQHQQEREAKAVFAASSQQVMDASQTPLEPLRAPSQERSWSDVETAAEDDEAWGSLDEADFDAMDEDLYDDALA